jgi:hypothetical protein
VAVGARRAHHRVLELEAAIALARMEGLPNRLEPLAEEARAHGLLRIAGRTGS